MDYVFVKLIGYYLERVGIYIWSSYISPYIKSHHQISIEKEKQILFFIWLYYHPIQYLKINFSSVINKWLQVNEKRKYHPQAPTLQREYDPLSESSQSFQCTTINRKKVHIVHNDLIISLVGKIQLITLFFLKAMGLISN